MKLKSVVWWAVVTEDGEIHTIADKRKVALIESRAAFGKIGEVIRIKIVPVKKRRKNETKKCRLVGGGY